MTMTVDAREFQKRFETPQRAILTVRETAVGITVRQVEYRRT